MVGKLLYEKWHNTSKFLCWYTLTKWSGVERKNRHYLKVVRSLIFSTKVPKNLWGETILTTTYLINRIPIRVLKYQTPLDFFNMCFPSSRISTNVPLKFFCCIAFIHVHNHKYGKFYPRASKCIFIGYSSMQKGYKCFDPHTKKMFVTIDVTFFETKSYFSHDHP